MINIVIYSIEIMSTTAPIDFQPSTIEVCSTVGTFYILKYVRTRKVQSYFISYEILSQCYKIPAYELLGSSQFQSDCT